MQIFRQNNDENRLLITLKFVKQKEYWVKKLSGDIEKTSIPFDHYKKTGKNGLLQKTGKKIEFQVPENLSSRLVKLSKGSNLSIYIILLAALKILASHYTSREDIIIVSPIYKLNISDETINDRVFIRETVRGDMTCKELILNTRESVLQAYENQDYPFDRLTGFLLPIPDPANESSFSDITCSLNSIHDPKNLEAVNTRLAFSFKQEDHKLEGCILYDPDIYERFYLEQVLNHYINILDISIGDVNKKVLEISFLSKEEKLRLIFEFNDTFTGYPGEKTIHELFEEQVERTPNHTALLGQIPKGVAPPAYKKSQIPNAFSGMHLSYRALNEKSGQLAFFLLKERGVGPDTTVGILLERSIEMIIGILGILKAGGAYLPIDPDYPQERIEFMLKDSNTKVILAEPGTRVKVKPEVKLINLTSNLRDTSSTLTPASTSKPGPLAASSAYIMYTSGSTGKPKGVIVDHCSVVNYIKWAQKVYLQEEKCDFPLYSALSFDLTVTSIYVPLVSGNKIVVYGEDDEEFVVTTILKQSSVQLIKLTPTHLNIIRTFDDIEKIAVKKWIVGGENLTTALAAGICEKFQKYISLEIYNEYGPTETTVGCMIYKYDPAKDNKQSVPIGMPADNVRVYLLDRNRLPVPVGVAGEIFISGDGVARGYLNQPQLTAAKFLTDPFITGKKMFKSGDLGRRMPDGNILFIGRLDHQVKIRGYRIELGEIENHLLTHPQIKETVVIAKEDQKKEKFLCGYFVSDVKLTVPVLREHLLKKLPGYMIPSFFVQLEKIPLTTHGKIDRKALPSYEPLEAAGGYIPPTNEIEEKLTDIWAEILEMKKENISINSNFFELGGQSLKAIILTAKIHKELKVKFPLLEIFNTPTIAGLSKYIKIREKDKYTFIEPVEKKEYYVLSPAQKRLYFLHQKNSDSTSYNIPYVLKLEGKIDRYKLETTFKKLISRHENLRTSLPTINEVPVQRVHQPNEVEFAIQHKNLDRIYQEQGTGSSVEQAVKDFIRPFDFLQIPPMRVGLFKTAGEHILLIDMHHIVTDETSQQILIREFLSLYRGKELPALKLQYKDYSEWQHSREQQNIIKQQESYWLNLFSDNLPILDLPTDFPRPLQYSSAGDVTTFALNRDQTKHLKDISKEFEATLYMSILSIFTILLSKLSGQEDITVGTPIAGRTHSDLEHIVGIFVNTLPMRNYPKGGKTFKGFLKEVKERTVAAFENQEYQLDNLVARTAGLRDTSRSPLFDVLVTSPVMDTPPVDIPGEEIPGFWITPHNINKQTAKFDMILHCQQTGDTLLFTFEYSTTLFKKETIERFYGYFKEIISEIVENPDKKIEDIEIIKKEKRDQLIEKIREDKGELTKNVEECQEIPGILEADFDY